MTAGAGSTQLRHIRGHQGRFGNEPADVLACSEKSEYNHDNRLSSMHTGSRFADVLWAMVFNRWLEVMAKDLYCLYDLEISHD